MAWYFNTRRSGIYKVEFPFLEVEGSFILLLGIFGLLSGSSWNHHGFFIRHFRKSCGLCHWVLHKVTPSGQGIPKITTIGSCLGGGYFGNSLLLRTYHPTPNHSTIQPQIEKKLHGKWQSRETNDGSTWYANSASWQRPPQYRNNRETKDSTWTLFPAVEEAP
jgi:hypothetical protein